MYQGKHYVEKKKRNTKSILLAIVAMIELLLLSSTMTFSWFEGTTALAIVGEDLKTSKGLKSSFTVGENNSNVKYDNTAELNEYLEMQANAKFSPVSSYNGEDFYALMDGTAADGKAPDSYDEYLEGINKGKLKFRKLSNEEKNSSLIYFQFQVTAATSKTDFWFKEYPTFTVTKPDGTKVVFGGYNPEEKEEKDKYVNVDNPFRIRIGDGTVNAANREGNLCMTMRPYWSKEGVVETITKRGDLTAISSIDSNGFANLDDTGALCNRMPMKIFGYTASSGATADSNNNGSQVLFSIDPAKTKTKTITIAIWLEALDKSYSSELIPPGSTLDVDLKFCSSWDVIDTITFRDYTAEQWVDNLDNGKTKRLGIINEGSSNRYWYGDFKYNSSTHTWTGKIPRAVQNVKFVWQDVGSTSENQSWVTATRGTNTVFTAFGSTAGIWYDGDVTQIGLSDNTNDGWLDDVDNEGKPIKMRVEIDYSGTSLQYSMTGTPVADKFGKNTWYAFIPSSIDDVKFSRWNNKADTTYNEWNANDRGTETIYRVYDNKKVEVDTSNTVFLQIPANIEEKFFKNSYAPNISLTGDSNADYINSLKGNLSALKKNNSYYPQNDTWPTNSSNHKNGKMENIDGTYIWYYEFDSIANEDLLTFWDCDSATHNELDNDTRFAPAVSFDKTKGNMFIIDGYVELEDPAFTDTSYVFTGHWDFYGSQDGETEVNVTNGVWGTITIPDGPAAYFKHYDTSVKSMTATFTYDSSTLTVNMTKGSDNLTWSTTAIPDGVKSIDFSDGTNTWKTSNRSTYCFALDKSHYEWHSTNTYNRIYLTRNYKWDDLRVYYTSSNGNSDGWPGTSMKKLKTNSNNEEVYVALVRTNPNLIIFNGTEGERKQTKDITENINNDLQGFYFLSWDDNVKRANTSTWNVTVDFLNK